MKRKLRQFVAIALSAAMAVSFGSFGSIPGSFSSNIPGLLTEVNASSLTVKDNIETTASSGKIIIGVEGVNCTSDMKTLLDRINKIRKEACDAGNVPDPRDTTKCLKSSDYKPLQIGVNTMKAAEMRAAEASLNFTHTRPNGKNSYTIIRSFVPNTSVAENLAWNSKMSSDIEGWISEKDDWIKYKGDDSEANIGHYGALINPDYLYTGMATFNPVNDSAPYDWSCTAGSYSSDDTALSKLPGVQNSTYIQKMEIPISNVTASDVVGESVVSIGSSVDYQLLVAAKFTSDYTNVVVDCPVYSGLSWSTSDSTVITIDSTGKATAKKAGRASITAVFGSKKASREIVVVPNDTSVTSVANPSMVTTETKTVPVLAKSVEATLSDGQKVNVDATWKIYDTARLLTHFMSYEFDVKGTAMGKKVTQRVHVNAAKIEDVYPSVSDVTTNCGSLPQNITVKVVLSNGYTWNYPSNWNSYYFTVWDRDSLEQCNTAAGGDFKITGYIKIKTDKGVEKFPVSVDLHVNPGTPSTDLMKNIPVIGTDVNNYAGGGISVEETDFNDDLDEPDEDPEDSGSGGNGSDSGSGGSGGNGSDSGSGGSGGNGSDSGSGGSGGNSSDSGSNGTGNDGTGISDAGDEAIPQPTYEPTNPATTPIYRNEWRDGIWYDENGNNTYSGTLSWKCNSTGWWVEDSSGWYPISSWQKIDGYWYYFGSSGYMASSEWIGGYWLNADGSCTYSGTASWAGNSMGWWYVDTTGWYPYSQWQKIDEKWYYFEDSGYMATNKRIDGYWVGADGACQ